MLDPVFPSAVADPEEVSLEEGISGISQRFAPGFGQARWVPGRRWFLVMVRARAGVPTPRVSRSGGGVPTENIVGRVSVRGREPEDTNPGLSSALTLPVELESLSVPPDDRVGLDKHERLALPGPEAMQGDPQKPIRRLEPDQSSLGPLQNAQLMVQGQDLKLQRDPGSHCGEQRDEQRSQDNARGAGR